MVKRRLLLALLGLIAAIAPLTARAQEQPPVSLEVEAGFDGAGAYRVGHWFGATIVAANDGGDLRGTIEWRFPGASGTTFRYALDLPRGARKRIVLPVVTSETLRSATVAFVADNAELARRQVRLQPITSDQVAVGVVSSDRTLLTSLRAATFANGLDTTVVHLDALRLPEDAALLAGLDALFIHDVATADLTSAQRDALALWTRLGGQLVVGGGPSAERTAPGLDALLPVEVGALRPAVPAEGLATLAGRDDLAEGVGELTASATTVRAGATTLDSTGLLISRDEGAGRVIFAAFDLAALRAWAGEAELWAKVVSIEERAQIGHSFRLRSENLLRDTLQLQALRLPSTGLLLLLIALYIAVVGPLNFWALRRAGRIELAWVTTPLIVALFLGAAYGASFVLRGNRPQLTQLTVVQAFEGASQGQATGFLAIFSPQRRTYTLDFEPNTLITPTTFEGFQLRAVDVVGDDSSTSVRNLLMDVSSLRTLMVERPVSSVPAVTSALTRDAGQVSGMVRLDEGPILHDAQLVYGSSSQQLGDLQPGQEAAIDLRTTLENFPDQVVLTQGGSINRDRVMYSLFGYDRFATGGPTFQGTKGLPEIDGVYLIGWANGPALPLRLADAPGNQQGETLYVIRLDV